MKDASRGRFHRLIKYLTDTQGKATRVGEIRVYTNYVTDSLAWTVGEIQATQRMNVTAKSDKTYHFIISLQAGEKVSAETLHQIRTVVVPV